MKFNKHRYGFTIMITKNLFFDMDINDWYFLPSIYFNKMKDINRLVISFLCFELTAYKWKGWNNAK